jgi:hypothetical protein
MIPNASPDIDKITAAHRKLAILKTLHRQTGFSASERVMGEWLHQLAMGGTRDIIRMALEELAQLQLIKTELRGFDSDTMVFWLTERGLDYLEFRTTIDALPKIGPGYSPY